MANKEVWVGNNLSKKSIREHITPHKIAVAILIKEYWNLKAEAIGQAKLADENLSEDNMQIPEPYFRRNFSMLILHLIQCPDMDYKELVDLLEFGKYKLVPKLLKNFLTEMEGFTQRDVSSLMDAVANLGRLIIDPIFFINKSSPIGVYLRRVMLFFDKLNFSQTVSLFRGFQHYVLRCKQHKVDEVKCNLFKEPLENSPMPSVLPSSSSMEFNSSMEETSCSIAQDMERVRIDKDEPLEEVPALWSRRQAELFIARQTNWLQNNESCALPPPQLQGVIRQVIQANPEHFEAHFLSYLNCLRVKELGGALDSLYHYFDRSTASSQDKDAKGYRYASLNLAILHAQFGHRDEALTALREAIWLSHEVNDNVCLQHAQSWLYKLTNENKEILMERSISKCSDLSLNYLTSLGLQSFAQFAGTTGGKPALVFEVLMRSDVLNCQFSMTDLMAHSFAHKAALWALYGKADMASLSSQLLLHLDKADSLRGLNSYKGEAVCQAICNMALRLTDLGEYDLGMLVIDHAKERFPNSSSWQLSEQVMYFTRALYRGQWQAAHAAVRQLATLNKWEALLREGELLLAKGESAEALISITAVLDMFTSLCPSVRVRALLLAAKCSQTAAVSILTAALSIANYHYLDYLTALVAMQLAHVQLQMSLPTQALKLMDQSLLVVLSHGGYYDQACALLLFVQCKVASVTTFERDVKAEVIIDAFRHLIKVRENFEHMEAYSKVKEAVYLQCLLANELGCIEDRNKFSREFRQLESDYPTT